MIVGGIVGVFSSLHLLSVELCSCLEVYNDGRWNCVLVEYLIMIDGGILCLSNTF
jgi:hypothetical protein